MTINDIGGFKAHLYASVFEQVGIFLICVPQYLSVAHFASAS
jgi:hypothetical protein